MPEAGFQVPTNLYGKHQRITKAQATKVQDKNKRDLDRRGVQKEYKNTYKLHTLGEIGYGPISPWSLKEEIKYFMEKRKKKPNTYRTASAMHDGRYMAVQVDGKLVGIKFRQTKGRQRAGLCVA